MNDEEVNIPRVWKDRIIALENASANYTFATQNDVTTSRTIGTIYQNKNSFPIMAMVNVLFISTLASQIQLLLHSGTLADVSDTPDNRVTGNNIAGGWEYLWISVIVPSYYYYQVEVSNSGGGTEAINGWIEYGGIGSIP